MSVRYAPATYSYTQPVREAMQGTSARGADHRLTSPPPTGAPTGSTQLTPDMRARPKDVRALQKRGLIPDPFPGHDLRLTGGAPRTAQRSGSSWLFSPVGADTPPMQTQIEVDEVEGQTRLLPASPPNLNELFRRLKEQYPERFTTVFSPALIANAHTGLAGTMVLLPIRDRESKTDIGDAAQDLVDLVKSHDRDLPIALMDCGETSYRLRLKGVERLPAAPSFMPTGLIEGTRDEFTKLLVLAASSGVPSPIQPIPDVKGEELVQFFTAWAERIGDPQQKQAILRQMRICHALEKECDHATIRAWDGYLAKRLAQASSDEALTLAPVPAGIFNALTVSPQANWVKLGLQAPPSEGKAQSLASLLALVTKPVSEPLESPLQSNPDTSGLLTWLQSEHNPGFWVSTNLGSRNSDSAPSAKGNLIVVGVRSDSKNVARGVQEVVNKIRELSGKNTPIVLVGLPIPGARLTPGGVEEHVPRIEATEVTWKEVEQARMPVYALEKKIRTLLLDSGASSPVWPQPQNLGGRDLADFFSNWADKVANTRQMQAIKDNIAEYRAAYQQLSALNMLMYAEYGKLIAHEMDETAKGMHVTIMPLTDEWARTMQLDDSINWIKLHERGESED